jgi:hypothetical protein
MLSLSEKGSSDNDLGFRHVHGGPREAIESVGATSRDASEFVGGGTPTLRQADREVRQRCDRAFSYLKRAFIVPQVEVVTAVPPLLGSCGLKATSSPASELSIQASEQSGNLMIDSSRPPSLP